MIDSFFLMASTVNIFYYSSKSVYCGDTRFQSENSMPNVY